MSTLSSSQARLLEASRAVARETRDEAAAGESRPAAVGDLYLLRATADFPIHWLLLEEPAAGTFLAVAADTHPFRGPDDLPVTTPEGPLWLRGRMTAELGRDALEPALRTGALSAMELARARRALAGRQPAALPADGDLPTELEDWIADVLRPARVLAQAKPAGQPALRTGRRSPRRLALALALAASLFLVCLGLLGWSFFQQRRIGQLAGRVAELEKAPGVRGIVPNIPVAILYPDVPRSPRDRRHWPAGAPYLTLRLFPKEDYPSFRLVIERAAGGAEVLRQDDLRLVDDNAVQMLVPRQSFSSGSYRLSLYGLRSGQAHLVNRYGLDLEME